MTRRRKPTKPKSHLQLMEAEWKAWRSLRRELETMTAAPSVWRALERYEKARGAIPGMA